VKETTLTEEVHRLEFVVEETSPGRRWTVWRQWRTAEGRAARRVWIADMKDPGAADMAAQILNGAENGVLA
jgi:hypothetical protein